MIDLEKEILNLTLLLYNNPIIQRNTVQIFIDHLIDFTTIKYKQFLEKRLLTVSSHSDENMINEVKEIFNSSATVFEKFRTEHLRFTYHKEKNLSKLL